MPFKFIVYFGRFYTLYKIPVWELMWIMGLSPFFFPLRLSDSCFFNCLDGAFSDQAICVAVVVSLSGDGCMPLSCVSWEVLVCVRCRCAVTVAHR